MKLVDTWTKLFYISDGPYIGVTNGAGKNGNFKGVNFKRLFLTQGIHRYNDRPLCDVSITLSILLLFCSDDENDVFRDGLFPAVLRHEQRRAVRMYAWIPSRTRRQDMSRYEKWSLEVVHSCQYR